MIIIDTDNAQFKRIVLKMKRDNADRAFWLQAKAEEERLREEWLRLMRWCAR